MTDQIRFTVLVDSENPATDLKGTPLHSRERGADRLAAALLQLGHDVTTAEAPLSTIAPDRWILYFGADPEAALARSGSPRGTAEQKLIIMDEDRISAGELIEKLAVSLVVTSRSYRNWLSDSRTNAQVFGRVAAAHALGIELTPGHAASRYAEFVIPGVPLPEGIVRYCVSTK